MKWVHKVLGSIVVQTIAAFLCIAAIFAPRRLHPYLVLQTPVLVLIGLCANTSVAHATLLVWSILSLVSMWVLDSMMWHNTCTNVITRSGDSAIMIDHGVDSPASCDKYMVASRVISVPLAIFAVVFILNLTRKMLRVILFRTLVDMRHEHMGVFNAEIREMEEMSTRIFKHMGAAEFLLLFLCIQILRVSLHFIVIPVTIALLPLGYAQGLNLALLHPRWKLVVGATSFIITFAVMLWMLYTGCDDFYTDMTPDFESGCKRERVITILLLVLSLPAQLRKMIKHAQARQRVQPRPV